MGKKEKLLKLRNRIIDEFYKKRWEEVWFYPAYKGVKGYQGTGNIMFLSLNPSRGNFPSRHIELYYDGLKNFGFQNAHLTDISKIRKTNKESAGLPTRKDKMLLEEEIAIIKPKLIVLLGKQVANIYKMMLSALKIKTVEIGHYSYRYGLKEKLRKRWHNEMGKIKQILEK